MDCVIPACQVALHKHQNLRSAPGFIIKVLSFGCHGWLHNRIYLCDQLPIKALDSETQTASMGKDISHVFIVNSKRKSTPVWPPRRKDMGSLFWTSLDAINACLSPAAFTLYLCYHKSQWVYNLLLGLVDPSDESLEETQIYLCIYLCICLKITVYIDIFKTQIPPPRYNHLANFKNRFWLHEDGT